MNENNIILLNILSIVIGFMVIAAISPKERTKIMSTHKIGEERREDTFFGAMEVLRQGFEGKVDPNDTCSALLDLGDLASRHLRTVYSSEGVDKARIYEEIKGQHADK
jgi:hypothetical protein